LVRLNKPVHFPAFDVSLDAGTRYRFSFDTVGAGTVSTTVSTPPGVSPALVRIWVDVPRAAWEPGYQAVHIRAADPEKRAIGHLIPSGTGSCIGLSALGTPRSEHANPREVNAVEILREIPLRIDLGALRKPRRIDISLDGNDTYRLVFYRNGKPIDGLDISGSSSFGGLSRLVVGVPPRVTAEGTDEIRVEVVQVDDYACIRHLLLDSPSEAAAADNP